MKIRRVKDVFAKNESQACVRSSSTVFYIFLVWLWVYFIEYGEKPLM